MNVNGSLGDMISQLATIDRNSTQLWEKLTESMTTTQQNIVADVTDPATKNVTKVTIPSLKFLQSEIQRLNINLDSLTNMDNNSMFKTKDGEFKQILINSLSKDPDSLTFISTPTNFKIKNNWFFEKFLNPLLCVNFDYTGVIPNNVKQVEVTKLILHLDTIEKLNWYKNNYQSRNDINYEEFIFDASQNNVTYVNDVDYQSLSVRESVNYGNFSVLNIYDESQTVDINGKQEQILRKKYQLDTLNYHSKLSSLKYTETIKVGDELIVNKNNKNTKYKVTEIDFSKTTVILQQMEGFDNIAIGNDQLSLYAQNLSNVNIEVPVGFDNYLVLFIRPIDNNSNIVSTFYSPGTAFFTNELQIKLNNGITQKLSDYYNSEVVDFGQYLLGIAKDTPIPSVFANKPNAPEPDANDFKVVVINQHLTNKKSVIDLKQLHTERNVVSSEISVFNNTIADLKEKISTKNYNNILERTTDMDKLSSYTILKENKKSTYNSLVTKISGFATEDNLKVAPKYRVRGFWGIPKPQTDIRTGKQEIIQFIVSYRYLNNDGDGNPIERITYKDGGGNDVNGSFSDWIEYKTDIRKKTLVASTGQYVWTDEETNNSDVVNINQLDLAIQKGETIEVRIKSLSEAGFPANPAASEWSNTVRIEFPSELAADQIAAEIIDQSQRELVKVELDEELKSLGITEHLKDTVITNGKILVHNARNIDSGYTTSNSEPINLYDKIKELDSIILKLEDTLSGSVEDIEVFLTDEQNNKYPITLGFRNDIFAGYYRDIISNEAVKMGSIVTRVYTLNILNKSNSNLILESLNKGSYNAISDINTVSGVDYNYGLVPVGVQGNKYDSKQVKGQYIYSRYTDINNTHLFDSNLQVPLYNITSNLTDCVVTNSMFAGVLELDKTKLYVHVDHKDVVAGKYENNSPVTFPDNININNLQNFYNPLSRVGFIADDKYLIGPKSTGAFLYMSSKNESNENLRVDGQTIYSNKIVAPKSSIKIPIIFQFRMTDYYGDTSNNSTNLVGRIGGVGNLRNLTYSKTIGLDFYTKFGAQQGFDIQFTAKYAPDGTNLINKLGNSVVDVAYAV